MRPLLASLLAVLALALSSQPIARSDGHMSDGQLMRATVVADDAGARAADYAACGAPAEALRGEVQALLFLCRAKPRQSEAVLATYDRAEARRAERLRGGSALSRCVSEDDAAFQLERMVGHLRRERGGQGCLGERSGRSLLTSQAD